MHVGTAGDVRLWHTSGMNPDDTQDKVASEEAKSDDKSDDNAPKVEERKKEIGGRKGLDPTRYGDWEKAGRCIDF